MTGSMESVRPVTAITGSNKFRALAEFLISVFPTPKAGFCRFWIVARRSRVSPSGRQPNSFRKQNVCLVRASRRRDLNVMGPQRAETAPISVARQGPLTCPLATFAVAICNGSKTSIRDIQSPATNVRNPPQPCGASIDWHSYVVSRYRTGDGRGVP